MEQGRKKSGIRLGRHLLAEHRVERFNGDFRALEQLAVGLPGDGAERGGEFRQNCGEAFRVDLARGEHFLKCDGAGLLLFVVVPGFVADESDAAAVGGEAAVGIVDAQMETELGARGEHAIGLVGSLADEVVDEDGGVGLAAIEGEGGSPLTARAALIPAMSPWQAASS